jgi:SAM-dependent methyltransferase
LSGYALEEIFLSTLLAKTGWANIKIGPEWERAYDEVTAKYLAGDYGNEPSGVPFGAVYLQHRAYTAEAYAALVENTSDSLLAAYMSKEASYMAEIPAIGDRTVIDLGAGHGRLVDNLSQAARNVVAIEINPNMYAELDRRAAKHPNAAAVQGDVLKLPELLANQDVEKPVFVVAQNSLGTLEGNSRAFLQTLAATARQHNGEIVLSLFRQPALPKWGLGMYERLDTMVGDFDPDESDLEKGYFVSKTGYRSKWWTDAEIEELKSLGEVVDEVREDEFCILRLKP